VKDFKWLRDSATWRKQISEHIPMSRDHEDSVQMRAMKHEEDESQEEPGFRSRTG
jgi:hypothetical protein